MEAHSVGQDVSTRVRITHRQSADCYDVDLEAAFTKTMRDIADHLESLDVNQPLD